MNRAATPGRPWPATHRTGGPIDAVFDQLRRHHPDLVIHRLEVSHPADDDNVYFLGDAGRPDRVQVDTAPHGQPPYLIEGHDRRRTTDPATAVALVGTWLADP
ncbi:MAG TPA: hypothetical protein VES42_14085 [Pilimelia sp.]|nr:hypothetical protein [Pilimelia sp.]